MNKQEYDFWVNYVIEGYSAAIGIVIDKYEDWHCRAGLAKFLCQRKKYEPAIDLFHSVIDEVPEPSKKNEDNMITEYEEIIWCYHDLGLSLWHLNGNPKEALIYVDKALKMAESSSLEFMFMVRGEIWKTHLDLKYEARFMNEALKEVDDKIVKIKVKEGKTNSYLFYGYLFKAEVAKAEGKLEQALEFLREACRFHELGREESARLNIIWKNRADNLVKAYDEFWDIRTHDNVFWDNEADRSKHGRLNEENSEG
ncbi:hypothetical protein DEAC_c31120 [Desulfosporosinus acididurans]|uniref:Tetratricopeptide repeat protein n=1 Tax=Desulfosporosinus acididurans TaxID=476652 RepID=A0A0J1FNU1_9FIRM|nr:tetratricopeptide repeat protein [Desulfosporosinus acididurans]KLU65145.1 hypothetical protein DEAC_c31120 [Desulfosporosinus acididurans]